MLHYHYYYPNAPITHSLSPCKTKKKQVWLMYTVCRIVSSRALRFFRHFNWRSDDITTTAYTVVVLNVVTVSAAHNLRQCSSSSSNYDTMKVQVWLSHLCHHHHHHHHHPASTASCPGTPALLWSPPVSYLSCATSWTCQLARPTPTRLRTASRTNSTSPRTALADMEYGLESP